MSSERDGLTDEQLMIMSEMFETLEGQEYTDALLAVQLVTIDTICTGAPTKEEALQVARAMAADLLRLVDETFEEIRNPIEEVTLQ